MADEKEERVIPYKIGLISTHGTGKTTLAHELVSSFKKRGYKARGITEIATIFREEGFPINEGTKLNVQFAILNTQMSEEQKITLRKYKIIITDRTVYDNLQYLERECGKKDWIRDMVLNYAKEFPYNAIYRLPMVGTLQEDGIRSTNDEFQKDIDLMLTKFLEENKIPHQVLPDPKTEFRTEWIEFIVKDTLEKLEGIPR